MRQAVPWTSVGDARRRWRVRWRPSHPGLTALWDVLRSRYFYRICDAVLTADPRLAPKDAVTERRVRSNYGRVQSLIRLTSDLFPTLMAWLEKRLFDPRWLPFDADAVSVMGFGQGSTVYLISRERQGSGMDLVGKAHRKTLSRPPARALEWASLLRANYRRLSAAYEGLSVVVPSEFVIVHGPLLAGSVVMCVQPFVGGERWDLFELARDGRLSAMLRDCAPLREQFRRFVARTTELWTAEQCCPDLIGSENLFVVRRDGVFSLQLIDVGLLAPEAQLKDAPERVAAAIARIAHLQQLNETILDHAVQ